MNYEEIFIRNPIGVRNILKTSTVGIAGCGGLGSNIAVTLVRSGVGKLIIADHDKVEISNLNRQFFFLEDVGRYKVEAIQKYLLQINTRVKIRAVKRKITLDNFNCFFGMADVMIEAFDKAETKKWMISQWVKDYPHIPLICASGLSGYGKSEDLKTEKVGNVYVCGDQITSSDYDGLCASRVALVASMQANKAVELLMDEVYNDYSQQQRQDQVEKRHYGS